MLARLASIICCLSLPALAAEKSLPLTSREGLTLIKARAEFVTHQGKRALHLLPLEGVEHDDDGILAIVEGTDFHDGTLELELSGASRPGTSTGSKGFIGVAFRIQRGGEQPHFECIYLRPVNGRSEDQAMRNHSVQYISVPGFGWKHLRETFPFKYESYVDLVPGVWTRVRVVVAGSTARLFVGNAEQPVLVVNDLKRGDSHGAVGLWSYFSTDAFFRDLKIR